MDDTARNRSALRPLADEEGDGRKNCSSRYATRQVSTQNRWIQIMTAHVFAIQGFIHKTFLSSRVPYVLTAHELTSL